jgi:hypothetical protein
MVPGGALFPVQHFIILFAATEEENQKVKEDIFFHRLSVINNQLSVIGSRWSVDSQSHCDSGL